MDEAKPKVWAGIDAGKGFHWAHVLDASGTRLLSRRVENDEADLLALIEEALALAEDVVWAVDQPGGSAALLLALLWERKQRVLYLPGLAMDRARDAYPGESKTDARDAYLIADQARMRSNVEGLAPAKATSPSSNSSSLAAGTSSPTRPAPSTVSGILSCRPFRPWSGRWTWVAAMLSLCFATTRLHCHPPCGSLASHHLPQKPQGQGSQEHR